MEKSIPIKRVLIAGIILLVAVFALIGIAIANANKSNDSNAAGDDAASGSATVVADDGSVITAEEDAKIEEFEKAHSFDKLEEAAIPAYLDKWGIAYEYDDNGKPIVLADRSLMTLLYSYDDARTKSSVKVGLSKHPISDAPEFVFDDFTEKDVDKILAAEKKGYGTKIDFSKKKVKDLVSQDVETMITNVVLGIGHTEQISGMYYGHSKTVYELSSAVKYVIDETEQAFKPDSTGYAEGMNRWVEKVGDDWYVTADYLANIIPIVNQIVDGAEVSAEAIYAEYNWGLQRADSAQLRRLVLSTEPDTKAALVYRHYFKDGELMEMPATNLRDRRPEIPSAPPAAKKAKASVAPKPGYVPHPDKNPRPNKVPKVTPAPTSTPTVTQEPTSTPTTKPKDPEERPTAKPKDDTGPGEPEETPKVGKSPSDNVEDSQHKPVADPQTGGTSQPPGSLSGQPGAHTSPGGQTVTDTNDGKGNRVENEQAETPPIDPRESDTGGKEGNNNGSMAAPD